MNPFGTLLAWANGFLNHVALPTIAKFVAGVIHDELPVAEQYVGKVLDSIPADLVASKPLVAFSQIAQSAGAAAATDGVTIGTHALAVAAANGLAVLQNAVPVTSVDATAAMNAAAAERDAAVAAANKAFEDKQAALTAAADKAAADLKAQVSN